MGRAMSVARYNMHEKIEYVIMERVIDVVRYEKKRDRVWGTQYMIVDGRDECRNLWCADFVHQHSSSPWTSKILVVSPRCIGIVGVYCRSCRLRKACSHKNSRAASAFMKMFVTLNLVFM